MTIYTENQTERSGFEPENPVTRINCLAGSCIQPLCHLSQPKSTILARSRQMALAIWRTQRLNFFEEVSSTSPFALWRMASEADSPFDGKIIGKHWLY